MNETTYEQAATAFDDVHERFLSGIGKLLPPTTPPAPQKTQREQELNRLSKLSPADYGSARKAASEQLGIPAQSTLGNGGMIQVEAHKVRLTDSQLTTSVSGGPQTVGGSISLDAHKVSLKNSQILSTATEGQGGTIDITSHVLHQKAGSVIDASSQFGTDGTVTIH